MILTTAILTVAFLCYQLVRANLIYSIRIEWLTDADPRFFKHSYDSMINPSKQNWYGFRVPKDDHYL